jgi:acyl-CoA synthetase (AMP-forming)/AMP-acid ligase II
MGEDRSVNEDSDTLDGLVSKALRGDPIDRAARFKGVWRDWGWMANVADSVNARLREAGIGSEEVIGCVASNTPECGAALLGLICDRRDVAMIYAYQSPEAIGRKLEELRCAAVIAPAGLWQDSLRDAAIRIGALGLSLSPEGKVVPGTTLDRGQAHRRVAGRPGLALLTSGTTGEPKSFHMDYELIHRAMLKESGATQRSASDPTPALHYHPFGNISGIYTYLPLIAARQSMIMLEKFSVADWVQYVKDYRPETSGMPSAGFGMVLDAEVPVEDLASIKYMRAGASHLDPIVHRRFEERYGIVVLLSYGATEFGGVVAAMTPGDRERYGDAKFGSVGRALQGAQFRIIDPETEEVLSPGVQGVLEVQAPRMGRDWIRTTDLAVVDEDGFLFHRGRSDGAIVRGGFKIVPEIIVTAMQSHPAISAAAVVGVPDRRLGEVPAAAYEVRPNVAPPSRQELEAHLRSLIPATHIPVVYRAVASLPRTPSLKLDISATRQLFHDREPGEAKRSVS